MAFSHGSVVFRVGEVREVQFHLSLPAGYTFEVASATFELFLEGASQGAAVPCTSFTTGPAQNVYGAYLLDSSGFTAGQMYDGGFVVSGTLSDGTNSVTGYVLEPGVRIQVLD